MKICVISSTVFPSPPVGYAGLEMITWHQAGARSFPHRSGGEQVRPRHGHPDREARQLGRKDRI